MDSFTEKMYVKRYTNEITIWGNVNWYEDFFSLDGVATYSSYNNMQLSALVFGSFTEMEKTSIYEYCTYSMCIVSVMKVWKQDFTKQPLNFDGFLPICS